MRTDNLTLEEEARRAIDRSLARGIRELALHGETPVPIGIVFPFRIYIEPYSPKKTSASV